MSVTPRLKTPEKSTFIDSSNLSIESSPMTVKDYKQNVENLVYENFTLKSLIWQLNRKVTDILQASNIEESLGRMLIEQEKKIAELESELVNAHLSSPQSEKDRSLELKEKLDNALDENRRLRELTEMNDGGKASLPDEESGGESSDLELIEKRKVLSICRDRIAELEDENKKLEEEGQQLIEEKDAMQDEIDNLRARIEQLEKEQGVSKGDTEADVQAQIDELQRELQELQDAEKEKEDNASSLQAENEKLKEQVRQLEKQLADSQAQKDDGVDDRLQQLIEENEHLREQLQEQAQQDAEEGTGELMNALRAAQNENLQLKNDIKRLESLQNHQDDEGDLRDEIEELQNHVDKLKKEKADAQEENNVLKTNIRNLSQQLADLRKDDGLKDQLQQLQEENDDLRGRIAELQAQIQDLPNDEENEDLKQQLSQLMQEKDEAKLREDQLRSEIKSLNRIVQSRTQNDQLNELAKKNKDLSKENEELREQLDILVKSHKDLENEIDSLRQLPRVRGDVGTSPAKSPYRSPKESSSALRTPSSKGSPIVAVRSSPLKTENQSLKQQNDSLRAKITMEMAARDSLTSRLKSMLRSLSVKSTQLENQVDQKLGLLEAQMRTVMKKMIGLSRLYNEDARDSFNSFIELNKMMFSDIRKGALICIKGSEKIAKKMSRAPITREDRRTLTKLQKKWQATIGGLLGNYIQEANELSMFSSFSPLRKDDSQRVVRQCQVLIHAIWSVFGTGTEPDVTKYTTYGVRFESTVGSVVSLQENGIAELKAQISRKAGAAQGQREVPTRTALSPAVVNLIRMVADNVKEASRNLHNDHRELMKATGNETSQRSRSSSRSPV